MANPTGFDIGQFKAASHPKSQYAKADPWKKYEAWRYTGPFSRFNRYKRMFPGLGIATVAFTGYCVYEAMFLQDEHHHEGGDHH